MKLSRRVGEITESPTFAVSAEVRRLRAEGRRIIDFGVGELDYPTVDVAKAAGKAAIDADYSHYTPTAGSQEIRQAIAARHAEEHGSRAEPGDVVVGAGAKAMLYELLQVLVDPGDDVVLQAPYWVSFPAQVALAGGRVVPAEGDADDAFTPRARHVRDALTPATKVVLLNSPCNPTGAVMPGEEVETVVRTCAERGIYLVFDEVYDRLVFDGRHVSPLAFRDLHPGGIACVSSVSKTFAMTGWRLGHAIAPGGIARALERLQGHVTSCPSSISQAAATAAYADGFAQVEERLEELRELRDLTAGILGSAAGLSVAPSAGTFFSFPRVDLGDGVTVDSVRLAVHLLREGGVAVVPGTAFGREGHVRVSFAVGRDDLERGLNALCEVVAALRGDPGALGEAAGAGEGGS